MTVVQTGIETGNHFQDAKRPDRTKACRTVSYTVGATGFEPATSCSRSRRATGLRYAPKTNKLPRVEGD